MSANIYLLRLITLINLLIFFSVTSSLLAFYKCSYATKSTLKTVSNHIAVMYGRPAILDL
nr:MAG TPA: hypothetical protein [Bacteriophage sp.]